MSAQPMSLFEGVADTSREALASIDTAALRSQVLDAFKRWGRGTADEIAGRLRVDRLSVRPRCSELRSLSQIHDTGQRRKNKSGKRAIVWAPVTPTKSQS